MRLPLLLAGLLACGCSENRPLPADLAMPGKEAGAIDARGDRSLADRTIDRLQPDTRPRPPAKWEKAASMSVARKWHSATTLLDGTVLVAGGYDGVGLASAERYDPATNSWSPAGTMSTAHFDHQAVRLQDGRVLVVGGCQGQLNQICMSGVGADLYDPTTNSWKPTGKPFTSRRTHRIALLQDGRALVVGGRNNASSLLSLELYDPASNSWSSPAATLSVPRNLASATTLKNGKVLIAGGIDGQTTYHKTLEVFDPVTGALTSLSAQLAEARGMHTATLLDDGRVLFAGGMCHLAYFWECAVKNAELYDPVSDKVASAGSALTGIWEHTATLLDDGRVLVVGGASHAAEAAIFDAKLMAWQQGPPLLAPHQLHAATRIGSRVLVTGGEEHATATTSAIAEIFTP